MPRAPLPRGAAVPVAVTYRVSHRGLQRRILLLLAADVIKGEQNVVVIRQRGGKFNLDLIVKIWGSVGKKREQFCSIGLLDLI